MSFNTKENYYLFIPLQFKAKRNKMLFQIGPLLRLGSKCYDWDFYYARVQNNVITDETFSTIQGSSYNTYAFYSCRVLFLSGWNSYSYVVLLIDLKRAEQAACYPPPPLRSSEIFQKRADWLIIFFLALKCLTDIHFLSHK